MFVVAQKLESTAEADPVLGLSLYTGMSQWEVIELNALVSEHLYLLDISSFSAFRSVSGSQFLYCPWGVDYM
jgi:hypothetical protein